MPVNNLSFKDITCYHCKHTATTIPSNIIYFKQREFCSWQCKCQHIHGKYKKMQKSLQMAWKLLDPFVFQEESSDEESNDE